MAKKYSSNYFKELREKSASIYDSVPALNWGEIVDGNYVVTNRYDFNWKMSTGPDKTLIPIKTDIKDYILKIKNESVRDMTVFIGTDSQNHLSYTRFSTVLVLYFYKNGAHVLVSKRDIPKIYDYRYRLLKEVDITGEIARNMKDFFEENKIPLELHSDFNRQTNFKSNGVVTEATNYFQHLGFKHKIKPEAIAASYCADYFC